MGPEDSLGCASLLSAVLCLVKAPVSLKLSSSVNLQQEGYPGVLWASIWEYPLPALPWNCWWWTGRDRTYSYRHVLEDGLCRIRGHSLSQLCLWSILKDGFWHSLFSY